MAEANEAETQVVTTSNGAFARAYCESISYLAAVKTESFRVDDFLRAVKEIMGKEGPPYVVCSSKRETSDYHLHLAWRNEEGTFSLMVEIEGTYRKPADNEKEPFAEDFFPWMSQFFDGDAPLVALVNADFKYPKAVRSVRVMLLPLPLKTEIGPKKVEVEMDGISLSLASKPEGISKLWITQRPDCLRVHLLGDRLIDFKAFDPGTEVTVLSKALDGVLEETQQ